MSVPHPGTTQVLFSEPNPKQLKKSWYIFFFQLPFLPELLLSRNNFHALQQYYTKAVINKDFKLSPTQILAYKNSLCNSASLFAALSYYRNLLPLMYSLTPYPKSGVPTLGKKKKKIFFFFFFLIFYLFIF